VNDGINRLISYFRTDLKRSRFHIVNAWMLLICFFAGQTIVYVHQHSKTRIVVCHRSHTVVIEKCQLCDAMHHNSMTVETQQHFAPLTVNKHTYIQVQYDFVSIGLILSAGRSPPRA